MRERLLNLVDLSCRVLLGESAVGKSSLVLQFVKGQFDDYRESTVSPGQHRGGPFDIFGWPKI